MIFLMSPVLLSVCLFLLKIPLDETFYFALTRHAVYPFTFIFKDF